MKQVLYFLAGVCMGLGGGYWLGKHRANKQKETVITETVHEEKEKTEEAHESEEKEVNDVARRNNYIPEEDDREEEYDEEDLQNDIEEIDDYICEIDHPEDDDEPAPRALERITDDDYYTSRSDFDKIRLTLDRSEEILVDGLGNDVSDIFARNGISLDQLYQESDRGDNLVYYRCWKMDSDYEIAIEEGDSE